MDDSNFETDPTLRMLTDALRAGPGSPQWHEALQMIGASGGAAADEHRLLVAARERLESGKAFRRVGAGPQFTRKVMQAIDDDASRVPRTVPTASLIAIVSGALLLAAALSIVWMLLPSGPGQSSVDSLATLVFTQPMASATFPGAVPAGWQSFGALALDTSGALRPTTRPSTDSQGAGILWVQPVKSSQPASVEVVFRVGKSQAAVVPQVFITDSDWQSMNLTTGQTGHEFTWLCQSDRAQVAIPGGQVQQAGTLSRGTLTLRISFNEQAAIVEQNGVRVWSGPHGLSRTSPRHVGVRFLVSPDLQGPVETSILSVRIQKP